MDQVSFVDPQAPVTEHFQADAPFWQDVYSRDDVFSVIHRERAMRAIDAVNRLRLPAGSRVLEIGCGAGLQAVHFARQGFDVEATDSTPAMIALTRQNAERSGVATRVHTGIADAHSLHFEDASFDLVVALGVLPWLHSPVIALREMARVLRHDGHLITNIDNRARLTHLIDPLLNPALQPLRRALGHGRPAGASARTEWRKAFDRELGAAGLEKVRGFSFGFGPFTFFGRPALRGAPAVTLHNRLQTLANRGVPGISGTGAQYMVVARKR